MVPSFMSREQAAQILATGKSVVFMREACQDEPGQHDAPPSDHAHYLQALLKPQSGKLNVSTYIYFFITFENASVKFKFCYHHNI